MEAGVSRRLTCPEMSFDDNLGPFIDPEQADELERADRSNPIPGGEPECPLCGSAMQRMVEKYPAPRGGDSPFRVRLVCTSGSCRGWTVYPW